MLADALAYAVAELEPAAVVDVATLTGAIKVALGQQVGGLFANDDALAARPALTPATSRASRCGGCRWPRSTRRRSAPGRRRRQRRRRARVRSRPRCSSSTSSATSPWAHLDIASTGDSPEDRFEWSKGPTGFGARLLLEWLGSDDPLAGIGKR